MNSYTGKETPFLSQGTAVKKRYIIKKVIGAGGFGVTYKAVDSITNRFVAVKEYFPQENASRKQGQLSISVFADSETDFNKGIMRFLKEAQDLAKFNSVKGVVRVYDIFRENGTAYMIMEYLDGATLKDYLNEHNGDIDSDAADMIINSVFTALEAIHNAGIIHRDISPDNIFICSDGTVKLLDFGAAKYTFNERNMTTSIVLKQGYSPPEQYATHGEIGPWTDIYALGATMYKMFTGQLPEESVSRILNGDMKEPVEINPDIPKQINSAIMKAMELDIPKRFQNINEFRNAYFPGNISERGNSLPAPTMIPPEEYDDIGCSEILIQDLMPKYQNTTNMEEPERESKGNSWMIAIIIITTVLIAIIWILIVIVLLK